MSQEAELRVSVVAPPSLRDANVARLESIASVCGGGPVAAIGQHSPDAFAWVDAMMDGIAGGKASNAFVPIPSGVNYVVSSRPTGFSDHLDPDLAAAEIAAELLRTQYLLTQVTDVCLSRVCVCVCVCVCARARARAIVGSHHLVV